MRYDFLIIGGGVAGHAAAEAVRNRQAAASIAIIGNEQHPLYSRVLLPHLVRGRIEEEKVFLKKMSFYEEKGIEYLAGRSVLHVDAGRKIVALSGGEEIGYGKLLLATGGTPTRLDVPGAADAGALYFQTFEDAKRLRDASTGGAVVVGGGFIALEFVMSFVKHGVPVTAVLRGDCFFSRALDGDSQRLIHEELGRRGVTMVCRKEVVGLETSGERKKVFLTGGEHHECANLGVGIGLTLNIGFLEGSGIETRDGIVVDEFLRTSAADVFAAGDVAEYFDAHAGRHRVVGNWTNASIQGKTVGVTMAGEPTPFNLVTSYTINCFALPVAFFGDTAVQPDERIVRRTEQGAVLQFLVNGGRIVGATLVGPMSDRQAIVSMLTSGRELDSHERAQLADVRVPLSHFAE